MLFALSQYSEMKLSWDQQLIKLIIHLIHVGCGFSAGHNQNTIYFC